ncbi:hypothetical protein [Saccharopolyspora phatthalungensis]|uniref:Uncharacterized protein n=1 Tax=Saccharopolyspora phatthalungensis TaxID=664693 RepID=A0A840QKM6_9PSEU|nr:hypothetical protein [Saccharopolyspora phatthalungensis]MBB5160065.1 hypothetical protein [Saccharopolyspora phatthalungensis]
MWAELRRARDAGEVHIGETLGKKFGKSGTWGLKRLADFRRSELLGPVPETLGRAQGTPTASLDVVEAERSGLVSELVGLVGSLRGLLVGAPVGYEPGLRARVEEWWVRLGRGELGGADVGNLRRRVSQAAALVERVRADRLGWGVGGSAVEGQPAASVVEAGSSGLVSGVSAAGMAGPVVHTSEGAESSESTWLPEEPSGSSGADAGPVDELMSFDPLAAESVRELLAWASEPAADSGSWPVDPSSVDWGTGVDAAAWGGALDAEATGSGVGAAVSTGTSGGSLEGVDVWVAEEGASGLAGPSGSGWSEPGLRESDDESEPEVWESDDESEPEVWESGGESVALQREFEAAERVLGGLDRDIVRTLFAEADKVLGPLARSARFRCVMAHRLLTHPGDAEGVGALRERLVGFLVVDAFAGESLRVAEQASGVVGVAEVRRLLDEEAQAEVLRRRYIGRTLGQKFNRNESWGAERIRDAKAGLTSRCHAAAASLRRLLAVAPPEYRAVVNRRIVGWLNIASGLSYRRADVVGLREQADAQGRADVELGELVELDGGASAVLEEGRGVYGDEAVDGLLVEAGERLGSTLGEVAAFRRVMAHQLLRDRDDVAAIDALRIRLSRLMATALGVSAGAGPVQDGGEFLPGSGEVGGTTGEAGDSDVDGVVSEDEWDRLRERLDRLRVSGDDVVGGVHDRSADSPGLDGFSDGNDPRSRLSWPGATAPDKPLDDGARRRSSWPGAGDFNGN